MSEPTYWVCGTPGCDSITHEPKPEMMCGSCLRYDWRHVEVQPLGTAAKLAHLHELEQRVGEYLAKWDIIEADPQYQAVWFVAANHGMSYTGPRCAEELAALRATLELRP